MYDMTKKFEGCVLTAYPDPASGGLPYTIGYGSTYKVSLGMCIDQGEADTRLIDDMGYALDTVQKLVTVPLGPNQLEALGDFVFNVGHGNFASSTLLKLLNKRQYASASLQFARWNQASGKVMNGLIARRAATTTMFNLDGGVDEL